MEFKKELRTSGCGGQSQNEFKTKVTQIENAVKVQSKYRNSAGGRTTLKHAKSQVAVETVNKSI